MSKDSHGSRPLGCRQTRMEGYPQQVKSQVVALPLKPSGRSLFTPTSLTPWDLDKVSRDPKKSYQGHLDWHGLPSALQGQVRSMDLGKEATLSSPELPGFCRGRSRIPRNRRSGWGQ